MKIEQVKIADLKPYERNARKHPQKQIDLLAKNIERFGFTTPVLIDKDNSVIAGHGRLLAMQQLNKDDSIPCVRLAELSKKEIRALRLADNQLAAMSEWDMELLIPELKDLDIELTRLTGIDLSNLDSLNIVDNPQQEWVGMPGFDHTDLTAYRQLILSFKTPEDVEAFAKLINQNITDKTRSLWYPKAEIERMMDKRY